MIYIWLCDERLISLFPQAKLMGEWLNSILCTFGNNQYVIGCQFVHHLLTKHTNCNLTQTCQVQKGKSTTKQHFCCCLQANVNVFFTSLLPLFHTKEHKHVRLNKCMCDIWYDYNFSSIEVWNQELGFKGIKSTACKYIFTCGSLDAI